MLALRLWAALVGHGPEFYTAYVEHVFDLAREFAARLDAAPDFELPFEPESNIVVFRYVPEDAEGVEPDARDRLQAAIRRRLIEGGGFYLTQVRVPAGLHLRAVLMNPLTTDGDLDALLDAVRTAAASS